MRLKSKPMHFLLPQDNSILAAVIILYLIPSVMGCLVIVHLEGPALKSALFASLGLSSLLALTFLVFLGGWEAQLPKKFKMNQEKNQLFPLLITHHATDHSETSQESELIKTTISEEGKISLETPDQKQETNVPTLIDHKNLDSTDPIAIRYNEQVHFLSTENESLHQELEQLYTQSKQVQHDKNVLVSEKEQWVEEKESLHEIIHNKDTLIVELQAQLADLQFEVNTLLKIEHRLENPVIKEQNGQKDTLSRYTSHTIKNLAKPPLSQANLPVETPLERCLEIVQKLSEERHFNDQPVRQLKMSTDLLAIENRRLFDALRAEDLGPVFVYSLQENKMLFAAQKMQHLTGWSASKFCKDFFSFLVNEKSFQIELSKLKNEKPRNVLIALRCKDGITRDFHCHWGLAGHATSFPYQVIGVLSEILAPVSLPIH